MADCMALHHSGRVGAVPPACPSVPPLRPDLDLYPGARDKTCQPTWILHDPVRNKFFSLGWLEFELLKRWSSQDPQSIVERVNRETTLDASIEDIVTLNSFLSGNQLTRVEDQTGASALHRSSLSGKSKFLTLILHRYLFFFIPLVHPDRFLSRTLPLVRPLFSAGFRKLLVGVTLLGLYLAMRQWTTFIHTFEQFFSFEGLLYFVLALTASKCMHEFGHAYTAKLYGLHVPTMGVAFLVMWPFLYTDTTESWKLASRRERMAIGIAGMFAELCLAAFATLLWSFLTDGTFRNAVFFLATASWVMTLAININPFMRWDGYYLLSDLLGVQNMQTRAFAVARWRLREWLFGFGNPPPDIFSKRMRRTLTAYSYATWLYRLILFLGIALLVYHFFFKALGIVLMTVELLWFIGRPIYSEFKEWRQRRTSFSWNRNTVGTVTVTATLLMLLVIPWDHYITAPAVLQPEQHKTFYAPVPARLQQAHVSLNQVVATGQLLFDLRSPELEFEVAKAGNQIRLYQTKLARQGSTDLLERRELVQQELRKALVVYRGSVEQMSQLQIKAPFAGELVMIADSLTPGRWVSNTLPLATLVDKRSLGVQVYVTEDQLYRVQSDAPAEFFPENPRLKSLRVRVAEIDRASTTSLTEPVLASRYGGPVRVRETSSEALVPRGALYRVRMTILDPQAAPSDSILRGVVKIKGESESWLQRIWRRIGAVLIRESGF